MNYENKSNWKLGENKANQSQYKANTNPNKPNSPSAIRNTQYAIRNTNPIKPNFPPIPDNFNSQYFINLVDFQTKAVSSVPQRL